MLKQWANNNRDRIMNKHEVIEIFESVLGEAWRDGDIHEGPSRYYPLKEAEALYALIDPLREFPEEEAERLYLDRDVLSHDGFMARIIRLWEGTVLQERSKGGCPTCGGRGGTYDEETGTEDRCEDCGGTGERRVGERRIKDEGECPWAKGMVYVGYSKEFEGPIYTNQRRSGEERRKD